MATSLVNLDALIAREDFLVVGASADTGGKADTFKISDLEPGAFSFLALRKPDFQRETANWSPRKIADFIKTFIDGDLIPAVICWRGNGSNVFIIDGAHRLSALIAWASNDYGDGNISNKFFSNAIPQEQITAARKTREIVDKEIGRYQDIKDAAKGNAPAPGVLEKAIKLGSLAIYLQWVPSEDAKKAEYAFFKINQATTPIDSTELRILNARFSPNAITSRVIVRNATGHKYWGKFDNTVQQQIETIGREIYAALFKPPLDTPIKTLDLPVAGRGYSAQTLPLIFDLVNIANEMSVIDATKKGKDTSISSPKDEDGSATIQMLKRTQSLAQRITGIHPSSLGLHPAVYFYSAAGRHQPTAVLAISNLLINLETHNKFKEFTDVRSKFEEFLVRHKNYVNQLTSKIGSGAKGYLRLQELYQMILDGLWDNKNEAQIEKGISDHHVFKFLTKFDYDGNESIPDKFSKAVKQVAFLKEALSSAIKCKVCGGYIHVNSIHIDHVKDKSMGGSANSENAQLTHPYCNSTYKKKLA